MRKMSWTCAGSLGQDFSRVGEVCNLSLIFAFPSFLVPSLMSTKGCAQLETQPITNFSATWHSSCGNQGRTQLRLPYLHARQVSKTSLPSAESIHSTGNSAEQRWLSTLTEQNCVLDSTDGISIDWVGAWKLLVCARRSWAWPDLVVPPPYWVT